MIRRSLSLSIRVKDFLQAKGHLSTMMENTHKIDLFLANLKSVFGAFGGQKSRFCGFF